MKKRSEMKAIKPIVLAAMLLILIIGLSISFRLQPNISSEAIMPAPSQETESSMLKPDTGCAMTIVGAAGADLSKISQVMAAAGTILSPQTAVAGYLTKEVLAVIPALGQVLGAKECVNSLSKCATNELFKAATNIIPPPAGPLVKAGLESCTNAKEKLQEIGDKTVADVKVDVNTKEVKSKYNGVTKEEFEINTTSGIVKVPKGWNIYTDDNGMMTITSKGEAQGLQIGNYSYSNINEGSSWQLDSNGSLVSAYIGVNDKGGKYEFPGVKPIDARNVNINYKKDEFGNGYAMVNGKTGEGFDYQYGDSDTRHIFFKGTKGVTIHSGCFKDPDSSGKSTECFYGDDYEINGYEMKECMAGIKEDGYWISNPADSPSAEIINKNWGVEVSVDKEFYMTTDPESAKNSEYFKDKFIAWDEDQDMLVANGQFSNIKLTGTNFANVNDSNLLKFSLYGGETEIKNGAFTYSPDISDPNSRIIIDDGPKHLAYIDGEVRPAEMYHNAQYGVVPASLSVDDQKVDMSAIKTQASYCTAPISQTGQAIASMTAKIITGKDVGQPACTAVVDWTSAYQEQTIKTINSPNDNKYLDVRVAGDYRGDIYPKGSFVVSSGNNKYTIFPMGGSGKPNQLYMQVGKVAQKIDIPPVTISYDYNSDLAEYIPSEKSKQDVSAAVKKSLEDQQAKINEEQAKINAAGLAVGEVVVISGQNMGYDSQGDMVARSTADGKFHKIE